VVGKIGSTPISVLVLIALSLIVVRSASLVLEERKARGQASAERKGGPDERKVGSRLGAGDGVADHYGHCSRVSATLPLNRRPVLSPARMVRHLTVPRVARVTVRSRDTLLATVTRPPSPMVIGRHARSRRYGVVAGAPALVNRGAQIRAIWCASGLTRVFL
jgi:hypothetical protein